MLRAYGKAGNGHKKGMGGLEIALGQHLLRVYLILGLCEHRICCFLKPKAFGSWGNWNNFTPFHQEGDMPYGDKQERKFSFNSVCFDGLL